MCRKQHCSVSAALYLSCFTAKIATMQDIHCFVSVASHLSRLTATIATMQEHILRCQCRFAPLMSHNKNRTHVRKDNALLVPLRPSHVSLQTSQLQEHTMELVPLRTSHVSLHRSQLCDTTHRRVRAASHLLSLTAEIAATQETQLVKLVQLRASYVSLQKSQLHEQL